jgi:hypothetical protein
MTEINWNLVSEDKLNYLVDLINTGKLRADASRYAIMKALQDANMGVGYAQAGNYRVALREVAKQTNKKE